MINQEPSRKKITLSTLIGESRRLTLTYFVLIVWIAIAVFAIIKSADLYGLAVYFASGLPIILSYLWAETSRPSLKDASEVIKSIGSQQTQRYSTYNTQTQTQNTQTQNTQHTNQNYQQQNNTISGNETEISIYSDDSTIELKVKSNQLESLINIGYIDNVNNRYIFNIELLDEIKSLLDSNLIDPRI